MLFPALESGEIMLTIFVSFNLVWSEPGFQFEVISEIKIKNEPHSTDLDWGSVLHEKITL